MRLKKKGIYFETRMKKGLFGKQDTFDDRVLYRSDESSVLILQILYLELHLKYVQLLMWCVLLLQDHNNSHHIWTYFYFLLLVNERIVFHFFWCECAMDLTVIGS